MSAQADPRAKSFLNALSSWAACSSSAEGTGASSTTSGGDVEALIEEPRAARPARAEPPSTGADPGLGPGLHPVDLLGQLPPGLLDRHVQETAQLLIGPRAEHRRVRRG